jgi:hypothetical protein
MLTTGGEAGMNTARRPFALCAATTATRGEGGGDHLQAHFVERPVVVARPLKIGKPGIQAGIEHSSGDEDIGDREVMAARAAHPRHVPRVDDLALPNWYVEEPGLWRTIRVEVGGSPSWTVPMPKIHVACRQPLA